MEIFPLVQLHQPNYDRCRINSVKCWNVLKTYSLLSERRRYDLTIDNQQVTQNELGWLAGAFDADGHMSMKTYNTKRGLNSQIELGFTNTSEDFLCKVLSICRRLQVGMHVQQKSRGKKHWATAWVVRTGKITNIDRLLNQLIPMLTVKRERAEILQAFCKRRLKLMEHTTAKSMQAVARKFPYTSDDVWYFDKFNELNKRVTPTTIPKGSRAQEGSKLRAQTQQLVCDDIV